MDQRAKSYAIGPRGGEIFNLDVLKRSGLSLNVSQKLNYSIYIISCSALTPDENGFHLG